MYICFICHHLELFSWINYQWPFLGFIKDAEQGPRAEVKFMEMQWNIGNRFAKLRDGRSAVEVACVLLSLYNGAMLSFIRRREEILHFQTTPLSKITHPFFVFFSQVSSLLSSRLLLPPHLLSWLSITIYSDSRSTSGSNLTGLVHTQKRIFALHHAWIAKRHACHLLWKNHCPFSVKERGFFQLCILMQLSMGANRSRDNIHSIYLFA